MKTMQDLIGILPYTDPEPGDQQDAQNTVALVWFATHMRASHGSLASQVKRHEDIING